MGDGCDTYLISIVKGAQPVVLQEKWVVRSGEKSRVEKTTLSRAVAACLDGDGGVAENCMWWWWWG